MHFLSAAIATLIERFTGYPKALQNLAGHPVQWMGALIDALDKKLNTAPEDQLEGRLRGIAAMVLLLLASALPAYIAADLLNRVPFGWLVNIALATAFIAQKSLHDHVHDVELALSSSLAEGRKSVALIVGRETKALDESGVARAALESLAENTADGIVAPVFWYAVLGLPGIVAYKAINTADSMIGHKSERYLHFGFAAARLDDLVNLPASRLSALLFAAGAFFTGGASAARHALACAWRDASLHRSPNAGWPEAAMAGALGLRFGGPRAYDGERLDLAWMGDGRENLTRHDISAGLALYNAMLWVMAASLMALAAFL